MAELHEQASNFAQGILNLQSELAQLKTANRKQAEEISYLRGSNEVLVGHNLELVKKTDHYQQRCSVLLDRLQKVAGTVLDCLKEDDVDPYAKKKGNGADTTIDHAKAIEGEILPSVVTKGPAITDQWK